MEVQSTSAPSSSTTDPQSTNKPPQHSRKNTRRPRTDEGPSKDGQPARKPRNKPQITVSNDQDDSSKGPSKQIGGKEGSSQNTGRRERRGKGDGKQQDGARRGNRGQDTKPKVEDSAEKRASPLPANRRGAKFNASLTSDNAETNASSSKPKQHRLKTKRKDWLPDPADDNLTSNLIRGLSNPPYTDCPICFNPITPPRHIWSCSPLIPLISDDKKEHVPQYCWTSFHLDCIKSWSEKSYNDVKAAWAARGEPERGGEWRCPGCQGKRNTLISGYLCFCGSTPSPKNRLATPHSCGNPCSRRRTTCSHPCPLLCHPGPCPPCKVTMDISCNCIRKRVVAIRCGDDTHVSCGEPCSKILNCGKHHCAKTCHVGNCDPCLEKEQQHCWCGKEGKEVNCGEGDIWLGSVGCDPTSSETMPEPRKGFGCVHKCMKPYDCGEHTCDKPCHPPSFVADKDHCPLSPDRVTSCPCSKRRIAPSSSSQAHKDFPSRASCKDPIPTCTSPCLKPQPYCDHPCRAQCHTGPCPPCKVDIVRPCRCGSTTHTVQCGSLHLSYEPGVEKEVLCERPCLALRSCGRHQCNRVCCPLASFGNTAAKKAKKRATTMANVHIDETEEDPGRLHECDLICGKPLGCRSHHCEERDHKGPCKPCLRSSFEELFCFCGRTVLEPPIPCGTKVQCPYPCVFPPPSCGHPKTPHNCHADDVPCPPCYALTAKRCACGKKEMPNVKCSLEREKVSCGTVCGKLMGCGFHRCDKLCHADDCGLCTSMCGKSRKLCLPDQHPCTHLCHAPAVCPEDELCQSLVSLSCPCGRIRQTVLCGKSSGNPSGSSKSQQEPKCTTDCAVAQRNKKLADALGINPQNKGATAGEVIYNDELVRFAKLNGKFLGVVEKAFADFVTSPKKTQVLPHMPPEKRKFVHDLASVYRMDTQMIDQEPNRSVQIIRRIDTRIPNPTLSVHLAGSGSSTTSLGKLADLRGGSIVPSSGSASSGSPWRSGNIANASASTKASSSSASTATANRGWTSVVGGTATSTGSGRTSAAGAGSGSVSPWNISRSSTPSTTAQSRGATNASASRALEVPAQTTPVIVSSSEPVPDDWEDDA